MRAEHGTPVRQIAETLGVSQSSVSIWVRDIVPTREQAARNRYEAIEVRARGWRELNGHRRLAFQEEGRRRAAGRDPVHIAGCMLYWAEGAKGRNSVVLANSDPHMMRFFRRFLRTCFDVPDSDLTVRLNVYLNNGLTLKQIEEHWLTVLGLPRTALRKHMVNHFPTSSARKQTCRLASARSASVAAHRSSSTSSEPFRSTPGSTSPGGLMAEPSRRPASPAAPFGRAGGSPPGPRRLSARRRGPLR